MRGAQPAQVDARARQMGGLPVRLARTGFAKLGAHCVQFGFEFGFGDLRRSGLAQALAVFDQTLRVGLADRLAHEALDRLGGENGVRPQ